MRTMTMKISTRMRTKKMKMKTYWMMKNWISVRM